MHDYLIWHKELCLIRPRPRITEVWQVRMEEGGLAEQSVFTSSLALAWFISRFGPIYCFFVASGEVGHIK